MSRRRIIAGNWKMNTSRSEAIALATSVADGVQSEGPEVIVFPPFPWIETVARATAGSLLAIGGQDCWNEKSGAYTGQVSPYMLRELCSHVIVGHSEHRRDAQESDGDVAGKTVSALAAGLTPIVCVGEPAEIRESGEANSFVSAQIDVVAEKVVDLEIENIIVAYEPIWAIGSGNSASPEDAQSMAALIRSTLRSRRSELADGGRILYGGSVSSKNAVAFVDEPDIDGLLVGGASLDANHFLQIVNSC